MTSSSATSCRLGCKCTRGPILFDKHAWLTCGKIANKWRTVSLLHWLWLLPSVVYLLAPIWFLMTPSLLAAVIQSKCSKGRWFSRAYSTLRASLSNCRS